MTLKVNLKQKAITRCVQHVKQNTLPRYWVRASCCKMYESKWKNWSGALCVIIYACLYSLFSCLDYCTSIMPKPLCLACVTLDPKCQINPSDNQAHPDLDIYSLLLLWRCGHLFQLLTYRVLKRRLSHPKHSGLFTCLHPQVEHTEVQSEQARLWWDAEISVILWTVQDLWRKVSHNDWKTCASR